MKLSTILSVGFLAISALPTSALAFPTPDEMAANFGICNRSDESWWRRFGQYVVAFDLGDAVEACRKEWGHQRPKLAACNTDGGWLYAGYYCESIDGGGATDAISSQ